MAWHHQNSHNSIICIFFESNSRFLIKIERSSNSLKFTSTSAFHRYLMGRLSPECSLTGLQSPRGPPNALKCSCPRPEKFQFPFLTSYMITEPENTVHSASTISASISVPPLIISAKNLSTPSFHLVSST